MIKYDKIVPKVCLKSNGPRCLVCAIGNKEISWLCYHHISWEYITNLNFQQQFFFHKVLFKSVRFAMTLRNEPF